MQEVGSDVILRIKADDKEGFAEKAEQYNQKLETLRTLQEELEEEQKRLEVALKDRDTDIARLTCLLSFMANLPTREIEPSLA